MVISSKFRMGQYRDDDHRQDAPHFIVEMILPIKLINKLIFEWHYLFPKSFFLISIYMSFMEFFFGKSSASDES